MEDRSRGTRTGVGLAVLLLAAGALTCFTGDGLAQQPCASDDDCDSIADVLGKPLRCTYNICDYQPRCGDGIVDGDEACDDGNKDDHDACLSTCKDAACGDGILQTGEQCDDGNKVNTDSCVDDCTLARCGDGVTHQDVEACDDGDDNDGDACRSDCTLARCGDGFVYEGVEQCDDGDLDETDACLGTCMAARCGDGFVQAGIEACDDGNQDDGDPCLKDCRANSCGDGIVDRTREGCDDQNLVNNDGCDNGCRMGAMALGSGPDSQHVCAIRLGAVRCWGGNDSGQLGRGNNANLGDEANELPANIADVPVTGPGAAAVRVVTGRSHTCVLLADGTVRCWGNNISAQLGNGQGPGSWGAEPDQLPNPLTMIAGDTLDIAAGVAHTCAVLVDGEVLCWGTGPEGQLGSLSTFQEFPTPVAVGAKALRITAGYFHTCALLTDGTVRCWGLNLSGQLGYGDTQNVGDDETPASKAPVDVGGKVLQIAAAELHTCALLDSGQLRCWGDGADGKLGYMNTQTIGDDEAPAAAGAVKMLQPGDQAQKLVTGRQFTCALLGGGGVRCWGYSGNLGNASVMNYGDAPGALPPLVDLGGSARDIVAGGDSACALLDGGAVQCWGFGGAGNHGLNATAWIGDEPGEMIPPSFARIYANP